jgi:hypothetical protein
MTDGTPGTSLPLASFADEIIVNNDIGVGMEGPKRLPFANLVAQIETDSGVTSIIPSIVDKDLSTPPVSPTAGARYIVGAAATGAWATHEEDIAQWSGTDWAFTDPTDATVYIVDENAVYHYISGTWTKIWDAPAVSDAQAAAIAAQLAQGLAETAQAGAESAEAGAVAARDAAFGDANIYADTATGLAAVAEGGQFMVVEGVEDDEIARYEDNAGVAVKVGNYPTATAVARANLRPLYEIRDSVFSTTITPSRGTLKALWCDKGIGNTYYAPGVILSLKSIDADERVANLHSTLFSGADPRPLVQDKGIYFNSQAGLTVASGILTKTTNFAVHYAFEIGVTNTYATKAAMDAAGGTEGDIALVNADTKTVHSPDLALVDNQGLTDTNLVNGYWSRWNATWPVASPTDRPLWKFFNSVSSYFQCAINRLGHVGIFFNKPGDGGPLQVGGWNTNVVGNGRHQISLFRDNEGIRLFLDGQEMDSLRRTAFDITDLNTFWINGALRSASATDPIRGLRHWMKALAIVDDCTWDGFKLSHDKFAEYCATPKLDDRPEMWGIAKSGQSWAEGYRNITDSWTTTSGWDGAVDEESANSGVDTCVTRERMPHVFGQAGQAGGVASINDFGPLILVTGSTGLQSFRHNHSTQGETIEFGMMKRLLNYTGVPKVDWMLTGAALNGATIAQLTAETSPSFLVQALKSQSDTSLTTYEKLLKSIVCARDFAAVRGQRYVVKAFVWLQGHTDRTSSTYVTDFLAHYDKFNAAVKRITGQSDDVVCFYPQINWSSDGVANSCNTSTGLIDQKLLDIMDNRGTRPLYCVGPVYQMTNFIHPYRLGYRWLSEIIGKVMAYVLIDGMNWQPVRPKAFTLGANYVDVQFYLMPGRQLQFATNANNIDSILQTGANNTYGFEYSGGGLTINAAVTLQTTTTTNDTVRVPLSGAPAAGHIISLTGASSRFSNLCDDDPTTAYYKDQDWTVPFVTGSPPYTEGSLNDLRNWGCAFRKTLT